MQCSRDATDTAQLEPGAALLLAGLLARIRLHMHVHAHVSPGRRQGS